MTKNFVFTSAGDNTNFTKWWCTDVQNYDIYVLYYGTKDENYDAYASKVHSIERRKGSKFQNFYYFYTTYPEIIAKYDRFFILDDDIEITGEQINRMFEISESLQLLICSPSFTHDSKISHPITKHKDKVFLEYTNFMELNTMLFQKAALDNLMKHYDPILIGWGIDYLAFWANGIDTKDSYAIVHEIACTNPRDEMKQNKTRELFLLQGVNDRRKIWNTYAKKKGCPEKYKHYVHKQIAL